MYTFEEILGKFVRQGFVDEKEKFVQCFWDCGYYIGDRATVISTKISLTEPGRILTKLVQRTGYVMTWLNGKGYLLHRLVAIHHIPNLYSKAEVNHIDCNKENNCADNLVWVNKQENTDHAKSMGRYKWQETPPGKMWRLINGKRQLIDEPV